MASKRREAEEALEGIPALLLTRDQVITLGRLYLEQAATVAAVLATSQEHMMDPDEAAADALDLIEALIEEVAERAKV